jgi:hypothetical protein
MRMVSRIRFATALPPDNTPEGPVTPCGPFAPVINNAQGARRTVEPEGRPLRPTGVQSGECGVEMAEFDADEGDHVGGAAEAPSQALAILQYALFACGLIVSVAMYTQER